MSILIKNMDIPSSCFDCDEKGILQRCGLWYGMADGDIKRHEDCPLVEVKTPHSRLIEEKIVRDIIDRMAFNTEVHAYTLALFTEHLNHDYDFGTVIESEE